MDLKHQYLSRWHWLKHDYKQRISRAEWKATLLRGGDEIIYKGKIVRLKAVAIGAEVFEISKDIEEAPDERTEAV